MIMGLRDMQGIKVYQCSVGFGCYCKNLWETRNPPGLLRRNLEGIKLLRNPVSVETPRVSEAIGEIPQFCEL